jgi:pimeloyl-ACP methyl ester carboxylesterase
VIRGLKQHFLASFDETRVSFQTGGHGDEWLVMANAPGMSDLFWAPLVHLLYSRFRILLWDYRGIYPSGLPKRTDALGLIEHSQDLDAILNHLDVTSAHFMGWCIGPRVLLEYYKHKSDRFRSITLLAFSYNIVSEWDEVTEFDRLMIALSDRLAKRPETAASVARVISAYQKNDYDRLLEQLEMSEAGDLIVGLINDLGDQSHVSDLSLNRLRSASDVLSYFQIYGNFLDYRSLDVVAQVTAPALILAGEADTWTPPRVLRHLHAQMNGSDYGEIPGGTHYFLLEQPKRVVRLFDEFLASREGCK